MFSLPPVFFHTCQLTEQSEVDWSALASSVRPTTRCALVQRSCGYAWRRSLTVADIQCIVTIVKVRGVCRGLCSREAALSVGFDFCARRIGNHLQLAIRRVRVTAALPVLSSGCIMIIRLFNAALPSSSLPCYKLA